MYVCLFPKTRCLISLLITSKCQLFKKSLFSGTLGSRGYFCHIDTDGSRRSRVNEARSAERKKNDLWSQELQVSFPCNFRIKYLTKLCMFVFIDADSLDLIVRDSASAMHDNRIARKLTLLRCIKSCHKFFSKKYTSTFKYIKRTEVS